MPWIAHTTGLGQFSIAKSGRIETDIAALFARGDLAELLDVGPGDERLAAADEHDRLHRGVGTRRLNVGQNAFRDARAECVDRRIIHGDDRHVALFRECHQVAHGWLFFLAESFSQGGILCVAANGYNTEKLCARGTPSAAIVFFVPLRRIFDIRISCFAIL